MTAATPDVVVPGWWLEGQYERLAELSNAELKAFRAGEYDRAEFFTAKADALAMVLSSLERVAKLVPQAVAS